MDAAINPRGRRLEHEADHLSQFIAVVKNECSLTVVNLYALMAWFTINFTFKRNVNYWN
jgi:hypothetical protein